LLDWSNSQRRTILDNSHDYAQAAHTLAQQSGLCDPERAWIAGLLAPLGWIAIAARDPEEVRSFLADPSWSADPSDAQRIHWGLDQAELARRLARNWGLPSWISAVIGRLALPAEVAVQLGAEQSLFQITQLAVGLVQQHGRGLGLPVGASAAELLHTLHLPAQKLEINESQDGVTAPLSLSEFLAVEADNRRLRGQSAFCRLEEELDVLHRTLAEQRSGEEARLRTLKLRALAEFAAGAGHEINNPLAVISGHAQYLRAHESDPARKSALEKIIAQTQRIHSLLRDLMQFARPPVPTLRPVDLVRLIDEVATSLAEEAQQHQVRLHIRETKDDTPPVAPPACMILADAIQVKLALTCLIRNSIEAAGTEGWVRVRLEEIAGYVEVTIEDSGPEMPALQREHLFDPFYSGRPAGRGTGLGLPTAWSLVRQQGGDVFLASQTGEPTRFILRLPIPSERSNALAG
jgi:signal transduction histidine kinase